MDDQKQLPPLSELNAFDGDKYESPIPKNESLPKKCTHKEAKIISSTELRCPCGAGWVGQNIYELAKALQSQ